MMKRLVKASLAVGVAAGCAFIGYNYITPEAVEYKNRSVIRTLHEGKQLSYVVPNREEILKNLENNGKAYDVLIIGGGATGTGAALDAATRGLNVALVEKNDFAQGTSSRATKMAHGGVRYLEKAVMNLDYKEMYFVYECLGERKHFFQVAPHLVSALPIITPCYSWFDSAKLFIGLRLYDMLSGYSTRIGKGEYISAARTLEHYPYLKRQGLKGSMIYYDAVFNDARVNMSLGLTAAALGAKIVNHAEVIELIKDEATQKVAGAVIRDCLTGQVKRVHAKVVLNATGCFVDAIRKMDDSSVPNIIKGSIGVHLALDKKFGSMSHGLLFPKTSDGRVLFLVPWEGKIIAGTTDENCPLTDTPAVSQANVDFIIKTVQSVYDEKITAADVHSSWSGIRPLVVLPQSNSKDTASIPRDHYIEVSKNGLVTITGGKWTSFRKMAEDAISKAAEVGKISAIKESQTFSTPLIGAETYNEKLKYGVDMTKFEGELSSEVIEHLAHYYGDRAPRVAELAVNNKLTKRLNEKYPHIEAEVLYQVENEYARRAIDVIAFRTNFLMIDKKAAEAALPRVVELMQSKLNWSREQAEKELKDAQTYISKCTL